MTESIRKLKEQGIFPDLSRELPYAGFVHMDEESPETAAPGQGDHDG